MNEETSWQELIQRHGETILRVAYQLLHNIHDAEDVAQQVLMESFAMDSPPDVGILKRMTVFRAIDRLRSRKPESPLDSSVQAVDRSALLCQTEAAERAQVLREAIGRLPQRQSRCFWLRHVDGLSNVEIAQALGISPSAVSTALHKAKSKLQESISTVREYDDE